MRTAAILEVPGKGAYAPQKIGLSHGYFLKTDIPGDPSPRWIWMGKIYSTTKAADIEEFNEVCEKIIPLAHRKRVRCVARLISLPSPKKKKGSPSLPPLIAAPMAD